MKFIVAAHVSANLSDFNPNTLNHVQWQKLGFSEKQASTILKYKDILGGKFVSKEQLKKCYAISEEKFAAIAPFILLPENTVDNPGQPFKNFEKRSISVTGKFNPDLYSEQDWVKIGFSEKQAEAILKYKKYLGGSFVSKEKFKECFIISSDHYSKLEPYLLLPVNTPADFKNSFRNSSFKEKIRYSYFDPNLLDNEGWRALGFSEKQAITIVNYRDRILKGSFKSPEDLQKCFVISSEKFQELKPYIKINAIPDRKQEIKQEKTDFSKTNLNTITFRQLLEFGLDEKVPGLSSDSGKSLVVLSISNRLWIPTILIKNWFKS